MEESEEQEILERAQRRLKKPDDEQMMNTKQVLEYLKISHMTLKRDEREGRIKHTKKGLSNINWYKKSDVEALKKTREEIH